MNLLAFRQPTHCYRTNFCELGLGVFLSAGKAWRWIIPKELRGRAHIGLLEYLAQIVSIWFDIYDGDISAKNCTLSMGDSANEIRWVKKSNFLEEEETHHDQSAKIRVLRKLAELAIQNKIKLYSQWLPGALNDILITFTNTSFSNLLRLNFRIVPIPKEIGSSLYECHYVYITYELQKNNEKNDPDGMFRSKSKTRYDSVTIWAADIVICLWSYEKTTMDTKMGCLK